MFYDNFSSDYDRFVNWTGRLAIEMPFLERKLRESGASRVLDSACGTGMHAIALAQAGFEAAGADLSDGMISRARENAQAAGLDLPFKTAGFGDLADAFGEESFDTLLCLGNSLPHLLTPELLHQSIMDFARCLKPGGLVVIQNRNFDAVMASRQRWMEPQAAREGQIEWLFQRFYDFEVDGLLTFNVVTLRRENGGDWRQSIQSTSLRPLLAEELQDTFQAAGFESVTLFGGLNGSAFDPSASGNLVITALRT
ncbi:Glycine/sarcosine N-methyltransferase [Anaerolineales bacterium]|nr:Glycine/sarcosine N-methyltransferase [Anaerolineales bacterium]